MTSEIGVAVPSLNQGEYLDAALESLFAESPRRVRVAVLDAGSTDATRALLEARRHRLDFVRSHPDDGQAAAVNEGVHELVSRFPAIAYVGWLNADDLVLPGGLEAMAAALDANPGWAAVSARAQLLGADGAVLGEVSTAAFSKKGFSRACTIAQPASLVRREAWLGVGGLRPELDMCFDYDLWWRLSAEGEIGHLPDLVAAASRDHGATKTRTRREQYFREAIAIVHRETGRVPWHWCISEALERSAGWRLEGDSRGAARLTAGARAVASFVRYNLPGPRVA